MNFYYFHCTSSLIDQMFKIYLINLNYLKILSDVFNFLRVKFFKSFNIFHLNMKVLIKIFFILEFFIFNKFVVSLKN